MIDLSSPENYHIVSSSVLKFLHHIKQEEGVCSGCFREILLPKDIDIQIVLNEITIYCSHCTDLVFHIQVFETDEDVPISDDEVEEVKEILHDPSFETYLQQYIRDIGPTI